MDIEPFYFKNLAFKRPNLYNNVIPPGYLAFPWLLLSMMFVLVGYGYIDFIERESLVDALQMQEITMNNRNMIILTKS